MVLDIGGIAWVNWTVALYEVGAIVAGAGVGVLCARLGVKSVLAGAAGLYALGCMISATAPGMTGVVIGRGVQGLGGGGLLSLCYFAMHEWFPEPAWNRLLGIEASVWAAGSLLGPLIGGLFANHGMWRGAFGFFALQALGLMLIACSLPADRPTRHAASAHWPFSTLGILSAGALMIALGGIARSPGSAALACVFGISLLYVAARVDRRALVRLLPGEILNPGNAVGIGLLMVLALTSATTGFWLYGPLILKILFGTNPLIAGYILAGEALAWSAATLLVTATGPHAEGSLIRLGVMTIAAGATGFALAVPAGAMSAIVACALFQGLGYGLCWPAILHRLVNFAPASERSLTSASQTTVQRVGYAVGTAAVGVAANLSGLSDGITPAAAKAAGFWVFAAFVPMLLLAVLCAWRFTARAGA
jgi:MFS family permease